MSLTMTDMFCGAGGSSTGAIQVPGIEVAIAMNHWARAIETHNTNHPEALHIEKDISQYDPRNIHTTDILWASPSCTNHSVAKGRKRVTHQGMLFGQETDEAADRSRATMWDVVRYAEQHDYKLIFTENVVDAARWLFFDQWLGCMHALGYQHHIVYMNSMHAQLGGLPAPQSRDRMYVVFWKKGNKAPDFDKLRPKAYCPGCDKVVDALQVFKKQERWGRYRAQYLFRCPNASCRNQIIEPGWLPAASAIDWTIQGERIGDRAKPLAEKTMARIRAGLERFGAPIQLEAGGNQYDSADPRHPQHGQPGAYMRAWPASEPFRTLHTSVSKGVVMPAYLMRNNTGGAEMTTPVSEVMRTLTTAGHQSLLMPYYGTGVASPVTQPVGTLTTVDRYAMITLRGTNSPKEVYNPMDTVAANGNHIAVMGVNPPKVEDCTFRMLEPHEIMAGMSFPKEYVMTGTKREQVKQSGNAVTPPAARDLISIGAETLQAF